MKKNWIGSHKAAAMISAFVVAAAAMQACGKGGDNTGINPVTGANSTIIPCVGAGCSTLTLPQKQVFYQACQSTQILYGAPLSGYYTLIGGAQVCRTQFTLSETLVLSPIPTLNSSNPGNLGAYNTGIQLLAGDNLSLTASGNIGQSGFFSCNGPSVTGYENSTPITGIDGQLAGLYASIQDASGNRSSAALIGTSYYMGHAAVDGNLYVGWDLPQAYTPNCTASNTKIQATITRCVDVNGQSYSCS